MSSIAAAWQSGAPPDHALVERMLAAAPHRGAKFSLLSIGWAVLGVSNGEGQWWASLGGSGRWACAIHGPVDNARELCELVGEKEVATALAALVAQKGVDALDLIRGTFAGVVTNGQDLICFRDHLGGRPLFFRQERARAFVATEAKQILAGAGMQRQPDLSAIELMFYRGIGPEAAVKGVSRVFYGETV
ncbi:MAG TPA: hypothetical protein VJ935_01965, partial [Acidimicrobiia bacterium]|nr:hypothetical protein [Acidimicrobiia bacterium]